MKKTTVPVFNLPQDIFPDKKELENIIFHDYTAQVSSFKGRSILHQNAISLVISGEKTMCFADKTVTIKKEECHFLSSGNCLVYMNLSDQIAFRSLLIFFDNKTLAGFYLKYDKKITEAKKHYPTAAEPYVAFKKDAFVLNFIDSVTRTLKSENEMSTEMKLLKFEELLLHLLEKDPQKVLSFYTDKNKTLDDFKIRQVVETNITNNITIEELAFLCNVSASTFKRRFTQIYKTSPIKWFLRQRMELAKDLLQHHHEKPSEVFYKVGYENHSSFTQSFKQTFGITPKEFQQQQLSLQH